MSDKVNEMRSERMGEGKKGGGDAKSLAKLPSGGGFTCSNDGGAKVSADFQDAGAFIRGGGKIDGAMENIGTSSSVAKGTPTPGKPSLEKGDKGPGGPGVI